MMNRCPLKSEVDADMAENGPETFGVTRLIAKDVVVMIPNGKRYW